MNYKELAKVTKACRKLGISHFKCAEYEITLAPDAPVKVSRPSKDIPKAQADLRPDKFLTEHISEEDLLLWSVTGGMPDVETKSL